MFDKNQNIIIAVLVIVLVLAYFMNSNEGFADTDAKNAEAIGNIASIYNKDEIKVTNVTATGSINLPRGVPINYADNDKTNFSIKYSNDGGMDGLMINSWNGGDFRTNAGGAKKIMWWNPGGVGMTDLYASKGIFTGEISGPTITATQTLNVKGRNGDAGYALYSTDGSEFGIWKGKDLLKLNANGALTIDGNIATQNRLVSTSKILHGYNGTWYDAYYKNEMVKEFKKSDPDGKKVDFLFLHPSGGTHAPPDDPTRNKSLLDGGAGVYQRYYSAYKYGNKMFFQLIAEGNGQSQNDVSVAIPN